VDSNVSGVIFRPAAREDEKAMLRMMRSLAEQEPGAYYFDEPTVREALRRFLASPDLGRAWIFVDGETPVGYIGRRAMQFVEERAPELGVNAIHLEVDQGNDAAAELYRRAGYHDHARFLMTKWLKPGTH
jgi:GNAT superfamily N-acetyltransferase